MTGSGFAPGEPVAVSLDTTPVAKSVLTADTLGKISGRISVPLEVAGGTYHLSASAASSPADAVEPQAVTIHHGDPPGGFDGSGPRG
ncbi:MAG: glycoside hydrolase family 92 protein [Actinoallomurus sp.]|nr:glycoside hydrolase family 92 protein [Actinoallomurus sp.]